MRVTTSANPHANALVEALDQGASVLSVPMEKHIFDRDDGTTKVQYGINVAFATIVVNPDGYCVLDNDLGDSNDWLIAGCAIGKIAEELASARIGVIGPEENENDEEEGS